ncbi:hypothetical protein ACOSQ3_006833 [Xanthoceras sorbifolium]
MIRDERGVVMAAGVVRLEARFSPQIVEATALVHGLKLIIEAGIIETYTKEVVKGVNFESAPPSDLGLVIIEVQTLMRNLQAMGFYFAPRTATSISISLSKFTLFSNFASFWIENCPPNMEILIFDDCPH